MPVHDLGDLFAYFGGFGVVTVCFRGRILHQASCATPIYRYEQVSSSLYCFKPMRFTPWHLFNL